MPSARSCASGRKAGQDPTIWSIRRARREQEGGQDDIAAVEYLLADLDPNHGETPEAAKARIWRSSTARACPSPPRSSTPATAFRGCGGCASGSSWPRRWRRNFQRGEGGDQGRRVAHGGDDESLGAAGTQNIDRILRLPGTANLPTKAKLSLRPDALPEQADSFQRRRIRARRVSRDGVNGRGQRKRRGRRRHGRIDAGAAVAVVAPRPRRRASRRRLRYAQRIDV